MQKASAFLVRASPMAGFKSQFLGSHLCFCAGIFLGGRRHSFRSQALLYNLGPCYNLPRNPLLMDPVSAVVEAPFVTRSSAPHPAQSSLPAGQYTHVSSNGEICVFHVSVLLQGSCFSVLTRLKNAFLGCVRLG